MRRGGKAVRSTTDYVLATDRGLFKNEAVRDPRHNSDHHMVMAVIRGGDGGRPQAVRQGEETSTYGGQ